MILLPGLFTRSGHDRISKIDNRKLVEFKDAEGENVFRKADTWLEDRVGFREILITVNETLTDKLFHKLVHPFYIYGKDGHVFTEWDLETFQHMSPEEGYVEDFCSYIDSLRDLCEDQGTQFIFVLPPNKESVYPEYYADGYNVNPQKNRTELIKEKFDEMGIDYVFPGERFIKLKENVTLYNKIYDVGHWNAAGAFYACEELFEHLKKTNENLSGLNINDYEITEKTEKYLRESMEYMPDRVPEYTYKHTPMENDADNFYGDGIRILHGSSEYTFHGEKKDEKEKPRILISEDSFFGESNVCQYFYDNASELFTMHTMNLADIDYYLSTIKPDIYIFECCERSLEDNGLFGHEYVKKRFYTGSVNGEEFNIVECDADKLGLEETYIFEGNKKGYVSVEGQLDDSVEYPDFIMAELGGNTYFACDDDFFDKDNRNMIFTFRTGDTEELNDIKYYLVYKK